MNGSDLFLKFLVNKGIQSKLVGKIPNDSIKNVYIPRARMEMETFAQVGISDYFLILWGIYRFCREHNIPTGPGRGSACGCLTSNLIGVTQVNPIPFGLIFERFYNAGRAETRQLPDIDFDVSQEHRDRIIDEYLIPTYGPEFIAPIGTFGKIQAKSAVKHLGRVLQVPLEETNKISKLIPESRGIVGTLQEAMEEKNADGSPTPAAKYLADMQKLYPELFKWVPIVDEMNVIQNESIHAAGVIVSPTVIGDYVPLRWNAPKKIACTMYDMYELENTGALKLDLLGLRNLDIVNSTINHAKLGMKYHDFIESIPYDDEKTWNLLRAGKCIGVFQFESPFMRQIVKDVQPESIEDLSAINALGRPGPLDALFELNDEDINFSVPGELPPFLKRKAKKVDGKLKINMIEVYIARKIGELKTVYDHPTLEPILKDTQSVIVYQESVMKIATDLAGFSLPEADVLRKIMGKKQTEKMPGQHDKFINGCAANGIPEETAEKIWGQIETFAQYGFNKCLAKGSQVHTMRGTINIEDVKIGDQVLSVGKDLKETEDGRFLPVFRWRNVRDVMNNGIKECVKVTTEHGFEHTSTPNHKIVTANGQKLVSDLKIGDELIISKHVPQIKVENKWSVHEAILLGLSLNANVKITKRLFNYKTRREDLMTLCGEVAALSGVKDITCTVDGLNFKLKGGHKFDSKWSCVIGKVKGERTFPSYQMDDETLAYALGAYASSAYYLNGKKFFISAVSPRIREDVRNAFARLGVFLTSYEIKVNGYKFWRMLFANKQSLLNFNRLVYPHTTSKFRQDYEFHVNSLKYKSKYADKYGSIMFDTVQKIEPCGQLETYDLEVSGDFEDTHIFFADNILTHNSHSVAYSVLAYITAYLKSNYPAEFMASLISSDNDINKRSVWISDARDTMNLLVQPPDINKSGADFAAHKNEILFGLKEVKGVGSSAVSALLTERNKHGEFKSMQDFYNRVDLGAVNSGRFKALASVGAFNRLHSNRAELIEWDAIIRDRRSKSKSMLDRRQTKSASIELLLGQSDEEIFENKATKVQRRQVDEGKKTKEEIIIKLKEKMRLEHEKAIQESGDLKDGDYFKDLPSVPDISIDQILASETELLGVQISGTLATPFANEINMYSQMTVGDLLDEENRPDWIDSMCGIFTDLNITNVKTGQNAGKQMAIGTFVDLTGKIKVLIFSKVYETIKNKLAENKPFVINGRFSDEGDALICTAMKEC